MTRLVAIALSIAALITVPACGKGGSSCADLVEHIEKISGFTIPDEAKAGALDKCEKMTPEQRDCAFKATDLASLQACR